jgi:hypothetical protein
VLLRSACWQAYRLAPTSPPKLPRQPRRSLPSISQKEITKNRNRRRQSAARIRPVLGSASRARVRLARLVIRFAKYPDDFFNGIGH